MISDNQNGIYLNVYEVRVVIPEYTQKSYGKYKLMALPM